MTTIALPPLPEPKRMKFADVCALIPEGVYWGDGLTPEIARRLVEAGHAHAAAVSAAENARLREALGSAIGVMESVRIFVTSRERIKQPEGEKWFCEEIEVARAALKGASHE
jgi:hypothetical protein